MPPAPRNFPFPGWREGVEDAPLFIAAVQMEYWDARERILDVILSGDSGICSLGAALRSLFELATRMYCWANDPREDFCGKNKCGWDNRRGIAVPRHPPVFCPSFKSDEARKLLGASSVPVSREWLYDTWWAFSAMTHVDATALPLHIFRMTKKKGKTGIDITLVVENHPWSPEQQEAVKECYLLIANIFWNAVARLTTWFQSRVIKEDTLEQYKDFTNMKRLPPAEPDSPLPPPPLD